MSASKVYVLAPNMKEVLLYRKELKDAGIEAEVIRITSLPQLANIKPKELHSIEGWSNSWEGNKFDLIEYCGMFNISIDPLV